MGWLRRYWAIVLILIFLGGVVCIVAGSESYQRCISPTQSSAQNTGTDKSLPVAVNHGGTYRYCLGDYVVTNNPAITAVSTLVIAMFTIILAAVTNRQARLTKEALIADKAAFVFPAGYMGLWTLNADGTYSWRFRTAWRNSGDTAAIGVQVHAECEIRNTAYPPGHVFDYQAHGEQPGFLPPNIDHHGTLAPAMAQAAISAQDIADAIAVRKYIYLWGWVRYRDVFPGTPKHISKFCWYLMFQGDPFAFVPNTQGPPGTPGTLTFTYVQHSEGNTAEDE